MPGIGERVSGIGCCRSLAPPDRCSFPAGAGGSEPRAPTADLQRALEELS
jgi:hypothetical protein